MRTRATGVLLLGLTACTRAEGLDPTENAEERAETARIAWEVGHARTGAMVRHGFTSAVHRTGTVVAVQNAGAVGVGQTCTVDIGPLDRPMFNCEITIVCDRTQLYRGATQCGVANGTVVHAADPWGSARDQDPAIDIDLVAGTLVLDDGAHTANEVVRMRL